MTTEIRAMAANVPLQRNPNQGGNGPSGADACLVYNTCVRLTDHLGKRYRENGLVWVTRFNHPGAEPWAAVISITRCDHDKRNRALLFWQHRYASAKSGMTLTGATNAPVMSKHESAFGCRACREIMMRRVCERA